MGWRSAGRRRPGTGGGSDGGEGVVEIVDRDEHAGVGADGGAAAAEQGDEFAVEVAVVIVDRRRAWAAIHARLWPGQLAAAAAVRLDGA
jgi:hypothetical protein